jgi:hypothetical protein
MDPNVILAFVPEQFRPWLEAFALVVTALSALLVALRPLLAKVPAGPARFWLDALDKWLGILAMNTRPLTERVALPPKKKKP